MLKLCTALLGLACFPLSAQAGTKLLRFPDIHKDRVVFTYGGDLWLAPSKGGTATRLTAHPGQELFAKFSPDGAWIAFTGQYDGDEQVYVMPASGGVPRQLTHYPARGPLPARWGYDNQVYGWTPDGSAIVFRSMRDGFDLTDTRLYTIAAQGGLPQALAMPVSGGGDLAPDAKRVVYSPLTRDFRTWKRYEGGWAQDLYIYDLATHALTPIAHHQRTERDPMWIGDSIWFASDRDGKLNLYEYQLSRGSLEQRTRETQWDVRWPSKGDDGEIVYELGGELVVYDTRAQRAQAISIDVPTDGLAFRPQRISVADAIEGFGLSPKGERALFVARGDVFSAPIENGNTRNLTASSSAHDREARWSPDGRMLAYISDQSGEEELMIVPQDGSAPARQLTRGGQLRRVSLWWSPDSTRIATVDASGALDVVLVADGTQRRIAQDKSGNLGDACWSPDSRYMAFSLADSNGYRSLWIATVETGALQRISDELWNETEPYFDPSGDYLWFLSERDFVPQMNLLEWNISTNRGTGIFCLALRKDVAHPFAPKSDEVKVESASKPEETKPTEASSGPKPVVIDFEGLAERVVRVPVEADNYNGLYANEGHLFYARSGAYFYGRDSERSTDLMVFSREERKASVLVEDVGGYTLAHDGSKLLVQAAGAYQVYEASAKGKDSKKVVSTAGLSVDRIPQREWVCAFHETWRRFRDFFYVDNMHGYDWKALREQYATWLPYVAHRSDLNYVLGEMVAELNVGHAYVAGGDWELPERANVALFGGRLELDPKANRFRLSQIFAGHNSEPTYRSPLTEVGVGAQLGDYVLAIDGVELKGDDDPYRLLRHKANGVVEWTVNSQPSFEGARKLRYQPIRSETDLLYLRWTASKRALVEKLSNGRIGYMHIPDMGADGIREFQKWFYGQIRKDGLIIDDRNNGGGNVSQIIIERLRRVLMASEFSRHNQYTGTYPNVVFTGPMACLINENSASDGDIFPWMFQTAKLGPVIGKRSWGGVVGITNHGPLIDGGAVNVPEFGHANAAGQWAVEGHGVDPDIVIENDPAAEIAGRDPQLERAVAEVLKAMETRKAALPQRPPAPIKLK